MSENIPQRNEIFQWLAAHTPLIAMLIARERENQILRYSADGQTDHSLRLLSEMPLCLSLLKLDAPNGYELDMKAVRYPTLYDTASATTSELHYYFQSTTAPRSIICLTAGQFVRSSSYTVPGARRDQLVTNAPEHVLIINEQLFAVVGKADDIESKLRLRY